MLGIFFSKHEHILLCNKDAYRKVERPATRRSKWKPTIYMLLLPSIHHVVWDAIMRADVVHREMKRHAKAEQAPVRIQGIGSTSSATALPPFIFASPFAPCPQSSTYWKVIILILKGTRKNESGLLVIRFIGRWLQFTFTHIGNHKQNYTGVRALYHHHYLLTKKKY
jgi:hypothetical protein